MSQHMNVKVNKFEFASTLLVYIKTFTRVCVRVCVSIYAGVELFVVVVLNMP